MGSRPASAPIALIARRLPPAGVDRLRGACEIREGGLEATAGELAELARGASAIVADPAVAVDEALLEAAGTTLRIVALFAVGYDNVDLEACRRRGVAVTNTPDVLTDATAELALALTMAAARQINRAEQRLRTGGWKALDPGADLGLELSGSTFGIIGLGRIGRRYAELARPLAGRLLYTNTRRRDDAARELGAVRSELPELLRESDVVSLHLPARPDGGPLIGGSELRLMRDHAVLVNTARGTLVDAVALAQALQAGRIGAAGLDVYEREPGVPDELLAAPNCVLLPHIGSATTRARDRMAELVAESVLAALADAEPPNRVA